jgi:hypothetical protein
MSIKNSNLGVWSAVSIMACGIFPAKADLPGLDDRTWVGYFQGLETKQFHFGLNTSGKALISPMGKKGDPIGSKLGITIDFTIQETLPDGTIVTKNVQPESLTSEQSASTELKAVTFRGKVTGDASFEATLNNDRGKISLGGKLLEPGTLKNPLRFAILVSFPNGYPYDLERAAGKKEEKAFADKIKSDRLQLKWTSGKSVKPSLAEATDAASQEINGPGISALSLEMSSYQGKKVEFFASDGSSFTLSNGAGKPLHEGFKATWLADPAKDPQGGARLIFEVK